MEASEILERAKTGEEAPQGWIVLPLSRSKVALGIAGWILGAVVGFGLCAFIASVVIPHNYQNGPVAAVFTTILLGIMLFIGFGSLWTIIVDINRLRQADKHLIVITPEDFIKQEGNKITHVPLMYVRHVTARGTPPPDRSVAGESTLSQMPGAGENFAGFVFGRGLIPSGMRQRRRRMRTPTTLAFLDSRTDQEVIVATDNSYGDTFTIAALLKQYTARIQQIA